MKNNLKTDRQFLLLSIPISPDQETKLVKSLMLTGCQRPITTWNGVIIDGHKRYRICIDEGIDFAIEKVNFSSEEEAISWVCRQRIPNYRKGTAPYRYLVGKLFRVQKQMFKSNREQFKGSRKKWFDLNPGRVSSFIGKELNLNHSSVEKYGAYSIAMDQIAEKSMLLFESILGEMVNVTHNEALGYATLTKRKLAELCKDKWNLGNTAKKNSRKRGPVKPADEIPLAVGIKEMPTYDPDMELQSLMLTTETWTMAIARVEKKTAQATDKAKSQLAQSLTRLKEQINELLEVMEHGRE